MMSKTVFALDSKDELTALAQKLGLTNWADVMAYVQKIPYGRNADRSDLSLVLKNYKGTCSSKHALLKKIADLNDVPDVKLIMGIFKMNQQNTPKIGSPLSENGLEYIPEAHCYLKINGQRLDLTNEQANIENIKTAILEEQEITPEQVGEYKVRFHKAYLQKWLETEALPFDFDTLWQIREQCIANLSM